MSSVTRTYFTLNVTDMARAVRFYREVLGPVVRFESSDLSELKVGDAAVALHAGNGAPRVIALVVEVADLDAACAAVTRLRGAVTSGPAIRADGRRTADVTDSEGNSFTLAGQHD